MTPADLEARAIEAKRTTAAPLSLLVGDTRPRAWELVKGITAPARFRVVERGLRAR
ncbi:hypothetical protein ACFQV2_23735 [Actinokineospora soli]|uniref:Uncharacterized protein n=1 Tax=Actinokineospora soli TaxID=1048753 RepID=A0ABW2TU87_9PSEU